jgi:anti-sigma B factor antagonist
MRIDLDRQKGRPSVVRPVGPVDVDTASALRDALRLMAEEGAESVIVDLGEVEFIDSSGLSALVSGLKALRAKGGMLSLSRPHPQALTALRLTMLDRVFPIFPTIEEAVKQGPTIP